ncbi:MAG TPA: chromate resistance protein ChrB domain-containing protein [Actinomycetota bacterium]|nr:chromate resistance protein ChrB domain-containing protein [Actinomycetota bacterium]
MKWVTRENANVDRVACPWLIKRFIDPDAEFVFVPKDEVLEVAEREGAHSYDAPGAEYTHRDGNCSFETLMEEFKLTDDPALSRLAEIVHAADVSEDRNASPQGPGLSAIAHGFALLHGTDDHTKIELETPMYDALYAWCEETSSSG